MPFEPGQSGNPAGRRPGIIDRRIKYRELLETNAEGFIQTAIDKAKEGDAVMLKLCIDKILPAYKLIASVERLNTVVRRLVTSIEPLILLLCAFYPFTQ